LRRDTFLRAILFTFLLGVARRLLDLGRGFTITSSCNATPLHLNPCWLLCGIWRLYGRICIIW